MPGITGIAHVNLCVPPGTLEQAAEFYEGTLGFTRVPVPVLQKETLAWYVFSPPLCNGLSADNERFDITPNGQQIHIAFGPNELKSSRHPCFKLGSQEDLNTLRARVWDHHVRAEDSSPLEADKPGEVDSGKSSSSL
jgi:catechol 2,3-dioxygenase-like lactoylglutathione lyase family enzyme